MIIVDYNDIGIKRGLWQYDFGQVLRIQGGNLKSAVEIHFSLQETGGEAVTRIGTTKDGVTDVVIPDTMLINDDIDDKYNIYVFIYIADRESGETEKKFALEVKSRPKPEAFDATEDKKLFEEAIKAVNESAERAETAEQQAAKHAEQTKLDAQQTTADRQEVKKLVESVSGIGEQVETVKEYKEQAQTAATNALLSEQKSERAKELTLQAQAGAETMADEVEQHALGVAGDKSEVERLATQVRQDKSSVEQTKTAVDKTAQDFTLTAQQALADVNNAGQTQSERVQQVGQDAIADVNTAKTQAVETVNATKTDAVKAVQTEGTKQTEAVQVKGQEVINSIPSDFTTQMATKLDKQQGTENAGKSLIIGEDGTVIVGEPAVQIEVDKTLAQEGQAADAKATGDKILQYAIKNTASGEGIVKITDSAEEKLLDFGMQGKTEQASTEGKNLFDANGIDATRHILGDLSGFSDIDVGSYNLSNLIPVKEGENIVKSGTTGSSVVGFLGEDKSFLKGVSITDGKPVAVPAGAFYFCCNIAVANLKNKIQIEKGNTATPYEPYTGAKPSPSPAYPQEIVSAAENGKIEVQVNGKNLLEGLEFGSIDNQGNIIQSTTAYININKFIEVKEGKHVINSRDEKRFLCAIFLYDKDKQFIRLDQSGDCVVRKGEKYINITSAKSLVDGVDKTQIELTDRSINPTAYEPYKGLQKVQFQLDRPLTKWDRLEKREGVWGIARQSVREELTQYNFDTYILPSGSYPTGVYCYATKKSNAVLENQSSFCTHFKNSNYAYSITNAKVGIYSDHGKVQYKYFVSDKPTVDEFKAWLVQQKEAGTPVELVYKTAEETWEPLPEEMQSVLNALHTNYPTTIISNSEDTEMQLTYVADTKNYTDRKIEEAVTAQVQNLANLLSLMPLSTQAAMIEADTNNILDMEVQK
jgi:hypothetical protein